MIHGMLEFEPASADVFFLLRQRQVILGGDRFTGLARQLAIDLWRLRTGQTTPQKLGLVMQCNPVK